MNLSAYAKQHGIRYQTAGRMWQWGDLPAYQVPLDTVIVAAPSTPQTRRPHNVAVCARVSSAEHRTHLDRQADRVMACCAGTGWQVAQVAHVLKECGAAGNDQLPQVVAMPAESSISHSVVEHQDRCSRVSATSVQTLVKAQGRDLVIINEAEAEHADLLQDFVAIITSFCARLCGRRWASPKQTHVAAALALEVG